MEYKITKPDFSKDGMKNLMYMFLDSARQNLENGGFLTPFVFLMKSVDGKLRVDPVLMNFDDDTCKQVTITALKAQMAIDKTDAYVMITEAWMATVDKGDPIGVLPVKARDDKQEGICLSAGTPLLSLSLTQVFTRNDNGNGCKFEFEEETFAENSESVFYPEHWKNKN